MTPEAKRIRAAINRLALRPVTTCHLEYGLLRAGDPRLCCFCGHGIRVNDQYRHASTIRAHETCFKAVAQEYKSR